MFEFNEQDLNELYDSWETERLNKISLRNKWKNKLKKIINVDELFDWYISNENQSRNIEIREKNANIIGDCLRFKKSSKNI